MAMLAWRDEYSVGIQEIDEQHKRLVALINKLYAALDKGQGHEGLSQILTELTDYTRTHFAVEECLMRLFHYPGYDVHKAIHDQIVEQIDEFQRKFEAGDKQMGMALLLFLGDWLFKHIQKVDHEYSAHLLNHGVKRSWLKKFW